MAVAVLIPAFNEQPTIGAVVAGLPPQVHDRPVHVTVIDDGSTDATAAIAGDLGADVMILPMNRGKGYALRSGLDRVRHLDPDAVVWMDADGQHPPDALPAITAPVLGGTADMVVGSRYLRPSRIKAPLNRRLVRRVAIRTIRAISGLRLTDPFSGYRCFSSVGIDVLELTGDRYESELEAFFSVAGAGLIIEEIAIPRIYSHSGSKMGYRRGDLRGRLDVLWGYVRTFALRSRKRSIETIASLYV